MRGVCNISKKPGLVLNELFHKRDRKFRKKNGRRCKIKLSIRDLTSEVDSCLHEYKSWFFLY